MFHENFVIFRLCRLELGANQMVSSCVGDAALASSHGGWKAFNCRVLESLIFKNSFFNQGCRL
jgi:hypothetical protein